jgi:transposase
MKGQKTKNDRLPAPVINEAFKRKVCEEYLRTGVPKTHLLAKYNIKYRSAIQTWLKQLNYVDIYQKVPYLAIKPQIDLASKKTNKQVSPSEQSLEQRVKELERLLADEQLRSEAYKRMIDIAEKELHIPIRKK